MAYRYSLIGILLVLSLLVVAGCQPAPRPPADLLHIGVSVPPQRYFVERIGGDHVAVTVIVPPGADAHTYEPKPEQLVALSRASVYFRIGVEFENAWMDRLTGSIPSLRVVDTTQGIERLASLESDAVVHGQNEPDPHIWLAPSLVKIQAQTIHDALVDVDPAYQATYDANLTRFLADIDALDGDIRQALSGIHSRQFMVFHPSWAYFAREYDLEMIPVEVGGQEPSARELATIVSTAQAQGIRIIFAQPSLSTRTAETIAQEVGGKVVLIDPLAEDWAANLRQVAQTLADVLSQ